MATSLVATIDNKADFNKRLQETRTDSKLLVLAFMAEWNESCKVMKPTFEGFASQFKGSADFRTVDVDNLQEVAREAKVEALPTFLLVKNGKVVNRVVGAKGAELQDSIKEHNPATSLVAAIDNKDFQAVAREAKVETQPTFLLVKGGKVVSRVVGAKPAELQDSIKEHNPATSLVAAIDNKAKYLTKQLVLEFTAEWSQPCKDMTPTVEGMASQFKDSADFCTLNVDNKDFQAVAREAKVETQPTFLLVKSGKVVSKVVDAKGAELRSSIKEHNPATSLVAAIDNKANLTKPKVENSLVAAIDNKANFTKRFQETKTNPQLLVLAFMAEWNESCKVMKPTFEGFASQFKGSADFRTVDVDNLQEVAREAKVEALPTFLLVKNGKVVNRVVGAKGAELRSSIDNYKG